MNVEPKTDINGLCSICEELHPVVKNPEGPPEDKWELGAGKFGVGEPEWFLMDEHQISGTVCNGTGTIPVHVVKV